LTVREQI
jgi:ATP-binding cassette, subfamily A (ABC1), member 3